MKRMAKADVHLHCVFTAYRGRKQGTITMDLKSFRASTETITGVVLIAAGLLAQAAGMHNILATALAPFGVGLILSDILTRFGRATRERVKIRIHRDD